MASEHVPAPDETQRVDKWLWYARFFKTRSLATQLCRSGRVRLNKARISKPNQQLRVGDILTFTAGRRIRVVRVQSLGVRRGPASEARALYEDLNAPAAAMATATPLVEPVGPARMKGAGRPTKREGRVLRRWIERS